MNINWKLLISLSGFGLAMALGTVWWIPTNIESLLWLFIFVDCAYLIARKCDGNYFLHGFLLSLINCIWVTSAHVVFFNDYAANHHAEIQMTPFWPEHPRRVMLLMGPMIGVISGLILGLFCFIASKLVKK